MEGNAFGVASVSTVFQEICSAVRSRALPRTLNSNEVGYELRNIAATSRGMMVAVFSSSQLNHRPTEAAHVLSLSAVGDITG